MADAAIVWKPGVQSGGETYEAKGAKLSKYTGTFSTPPTIAEINAATGWEQVCALYNRRQSQIMATPSPISLSYSGASGAPTAASINALRAAISQLRLDAGMALGDIPIWGDALVQGQCMRARHLMDARVALDQNLAVIYGNPGSAGQAVLGLTPTIQQRLYAGWHWAHTPTTDTTTVALGAQLVGTQGSNQTLRMGNTHALANINATAMATVALPFSINVFAQVTGEVYYSNTNDSAGAAGWWNNTNALQARYNITNGAITAGSQDCTALVQARRAGVISWVVKANPESFAISGSSFTSRGPLVLNVNFGF